MTDPQPTTADRELAEKILSLVTRSFHDNIVIPKLVAKEATELITAHVGLVLRQEHVKLRAERDELREALGGLIAVVGLVPMPSESMRAVVQDAVDKGVAAICKTEVR